MAEGRVAKVVGRARALRRGLRSAAIRGPPNARSAPLPGCGSTACGSDRPRDRRIPGSCVRGGGTPSSGQCDHGRAGRRCGWGFRVPGAAGRGCVRAASRKAPGRRRSCGETSRRPPRDQRRATTGNDGQRRATTGAATPWRLGAGRRRRKTNRNCAAERKFSASACRSVWRAGRRRGSRNRRGTAPHHPDLANRRVCDGCPRPRRGDG